MLDKVTEIEGEVGMLDKGVSLGIRPVEAFSYGDIWGACEAFGVARMSSDPSAAISVDIRSASFEGGSTFRPRTPQLSTGRTTTERI